MDNIQFLIEPEEAIQRYFTERNYLYFVITLGLFLELLMTAYIFKNELHNLQQLKHMYRMLHVRDFQTFF